MTARDYKAEDIIEKAAPCTSPEVFEAIERLALDGHHRLAKAVLRLAKRCNELSRARLAEREGQEVAFGSGDKVVTRGKANGKAAVFVRPAGEPGPVGEDADNRPEDNHRLVAGEWYMTFPTANQADLVADALCNAPRYTTPPPAPEITTKMVRAAIHAFEDVTGGDRLPDGDGEDERMMRTILETAMLTTTPAPPRSESVWKAEALNKAKETIIHRVMTRAQLSLECDLFSCRAMGEFDQKRAWCCLFAEEMDKEAARLRSQEGE